MSVVADHDLSEAGVEAPGRSSGAGLWLAGATVALLVGAGGLLWWRYGSAVFSDAVLSGLAWCF